MSGSAFEDLACAALHMTIVMQDWHWRCFPLERRVLGVARSWLAHTTMRAKHTIILLLLVALAGALVAAQVQGCELMDGGRQVVMGCSAAILPVSLVLGLVALALVTLTNLPFRGQLVLIPAYHPPRRPIAR